MKYLVLALFPMVAMAVPFEKAELTSIHKEEATHNHNRVEALGNIYTVPYSDTVCQVRIIGMFDFRVNISKERIDIMHMADYGTHLYFTTPEGMYEECISLYEEPLVVKDVLQQIADSLLGVDHGK